MFPDDSFDSADPSNDLGLSGQDGGGSGGTVAYGPSDSQLTSGWSIVDDGNGSGVGTLIASDGTSYEVYSYDGGTTYYDSLGNQYDNTGTLIDTSGATAPSPEVGGAGFNGGTLQSTAGPTQSKNTGTLSGGGGGGSMGGGGGSKGGGGNGSSTATKPIPPININIGGGAKPPVRPINTSGITGGTGLLGAGSSGMFLAVAAVAVLMLARR